MKMEDLALTLKGMLLSEEICTGFKTERQEFVMKELHIKFKIRKATDKKKDKKEKGQSGTISECE